MELAELLPALHELPRADKFRALQILSADLANEDQCVIAQGAQFPVWSPLIAADAAVVLSKFLQDASPEA